MPTYKYIATDIEWETDGDKEALKSLPKTVKGTITARDREYAQDEVSDFLSDTWGWLHKGFYAVFEKTL